MSSFAHDKLHRHFNILLAILFICLFIICALDVESDLFAFSHNVYNDFKCIESVDNDYDSIISSDEIALVFVKNSNSKNSRSGKSVSFRKSIINSVISITFGTIIICTILGIYSFKTLISSRHLIMSYIHNQDGMKL